MKYNLRENSVELQMKTDTSRGCIKMLRVFMDKGWFFLTLESSSSEMENVNPLKFL